MFLIKKPTLLQIFIALIYILDISFFYLISLPESFQTINNVNTKLLIAEISIVVAFICYFKEQSYYNENFLFVRNYCLFIVILAMLLVIHGYLTYPTQGVLSYFRSCEYLFTALLAIPILYEMYSQEAFEQTMSILNIIAFLWYLILILQSSVYNISGSMFLTYFGESGNVGLRNGMLRIPLFSLGNIMVFYNLYRFLSLLGRKKVFALVQFILGSYCIIFVQQTRAIIFAYGIAVAFMLLTNTDKPFSLLRNFCLVAFICFILYQLGVFDSFLESFSSSENMQSTTIRAEAISYYIQYWLKHPVFGMGTATNATLTHGSNGMYYMSDVGFVGIIAKCGVFAFALYGALIARWTFIIYKVRNLSICGRKDSVFLIGLLCFFIAPSYSISFFANAWSVSIPLFIAIFEFFYYKNTSLINKESEYQDVGC